MEKFNTWAKFEPFLLPFAKGDEGEGIANRRINPDAFKVPHFRKPDPAHFKRNILCELWVLACLKEKFRNTDPVKFVKVEDAIWNFKTKAVNWEDFV